MECSTVSLGIDEYSQTICQERRKARKTHKCNECRKPIYIGEIYEYYVGKMDNLFVQKTCSDCLSVRSEFFKNGYIYETLWEDLYEHINECYGDISESALVDLTPVARRKVCDIIEGFWEEEDD